VFGGDDCFITVWNWRQRTISSKLFGHPGSVLCLAGYFPYLLSAGGDSKLKIWKIEDEAVE
jgi:WD40 repeat protein